MVCARVSRFTEGARALRTEQLPLEGQFHNTTEEVYQCIRTE